MIRKLSDSMVGTIFVVVISAIIYVATFDNSTKNYNNYIANFETADGIWQNTPVYMNGIEIGRVSDINLVTGFAQVKMNVEKGINIPIDSKVIVETPDIFANKVLSILPGFEQDYMKNNQVFMTVQNSIDFLGLLNDYLDIKISQKKKEK